MRRTLATVAAVVVTSGLVIASPAGADQNDSKKPVNSDRLTKAVTVNGILQHERQLQTIANRNDGNRASGLPGHTASADYVAKTLRSAGYTVKRQKFIFPFSRELAPAQLTEITSLIDASVIRPVVDRVFPFAATREAMAYVESGRAKGKVVVSMRTT